jgi:hypothetical protein
MPVLFIWGIILWIGATVIFRTAGQFFLLPNEPIMISALFLAAIPIVLLTTYPLYHWLELRKEEQPKAAVFIALPGMLLDIYSFITFETMFPNLAPETLRIFGGWLMWAYSLIIITGLVSLKK